MDDCRPKNVAPYDQIFIMGKAMMPIMRMPKMAKSEPIKIIGGNFSHASAKSLRQKSRDLRCLCLFGRTVQDYLK